MRTTLNKAITEALNKDATTAPTVGTYPGKELKTMDKTLQKIADKAATITAADPQTRADYLQGIADAQAAAKAAAKAREDAESEAAFDKAYDDETHAKFKEGFFRKKLDEYDYSPRMNEDEYNEAVEAVDAVVKKAADNFRAVASKAIAEIIAAKKAYTDTADDADAVLEELDAAANVLQSKYKYRAYAFQGAPSTYAKDPGEWRNHAKRYTKNGAAMDLVTKKPGSATEWDDVTLAAWRAAEMAE